MINGVKPLSAGEVRTRGYFNRFDSHIGIKEFSINHEGFASLSTTENFTSNIHGSVHGGWSSANLDATSVGAVYADLENGLKENEYGVTASLDVQFKNPALVGENYLCNAKVIKREGNNIFTEASIKSSQGVEIASARGLIKARKLDYNPTTATAA